MAKSDSSISRALSSAAGECGETPLEHALRGTPITVFQQDTNLRYVQLSNSAFAKRPEHYYGKQDSDLFRPEDAAPLTAIKRKVLATGESIRHEVQVTYEGYQRHYDLTVEPMTDAKGNICGILGVAIDITQRREEENRERFRMQLPNALRDLDEPRDVMAMVANQLGEYLHVTRANYGEMHHDKEDFIVEGDYHEGVASIAGQYRLNDLGSYIANRLRQGETLVIPNVNDNPYIAPEPMQLLLAMSACALVAVPLLQDGRMVAWLAVKHREPRAWSPGEVSLIEDVAQLTRQAVQRARAERALRESEMRHRLVSELTNDYAFSYRVAEDGNHTVEWRSGAFERITSYSENEVADIGEWNKMFPHEDQPKLQQVVTNLLANKAQQFEQRIITKNDETRWLSVTTQPIWDDEARRVIRVIGAASDITARKQIEGERQQLLDRLQADRALVEQVIDQMPMGVVVTDANGDLLYINAQVQAITGVSPQPEHKPLDRSEFKAFYPDGTPYPPAEWPLSRALNHGEVVLNEELLCRHAVHGHWVVLRGSAAPVRDASGRTIAVVSTFDDITEQKRATQAVNLLAKAGKILASSLNYQATLRSVVQLSVPDLADWCQLDIVDEHGGLRCLAGAHADASRTAAIMDLQQRYPVAPETSWGPWAVYHTGRTEWIANVTDDMLAEIAHNDEHLRTLREAGIRSSICVPLKGRNRVFGVLMFMTDRTSSRQYKEADVRLAEELARRAAMTIEKALLYADAQRELAERREAERQLQALNETLEQRVAERTAEAEHRAEQLRALAAELTQAEQRERRQLAQTLHDHLQQLLVAAKLRLHTVRDLFTDEATKAIFHQVDDLLSQSVDASRSLTVELSPPILHDAGLPAALEWLSRWMGDKHNLHVAADTDPAANPASDDIRVFLFNAVRELLFNVVKHADTHEAWVELTLIDEDRIRVVVSDRGAGCDINRVNKDQSGFGLFSIQQRLNVLGGEARIQSTPGRGTRVEMIAPRNPS